MIEIKLKLHFCTLYTLYVVKIYFINYPLFLQIIIDTVFFCFISIVQVKKI